MNHHFRRALFAAAIVMSAAPLPGCGGSEPKVQLPEHPTPLPGPNARLKPLVEAPPAAPAQTK